MKYASANNMSYFETSAKENINVDNAFKSLITGTYGLLHDLTNRLIFR